MLLVVNQNSPASREIAEYYRTRRVVPSANICTIKTTADEEISWDVFEREVESPVAACLKTKGLTDTVFYIVTTLGVPLKVSGPGSGQSAEHASVDSELTLLYRKLRSGKVERPGYVANPFFGKRDVPFSHPLFAMYMVTRLAAYNVEQVKAMIDRARSARNVGKFILDLNSPDDNAGNSWLRTAAILLPADRVVMDESTQVLYDQKDVIAYGSWGSNDTQRKRRKVGFQWLPGAIVNEFVSTNGRTFLRPPDTWNIGAAWTDRANIWAGSPQSLSADYLEEGATGSSGHVYEPYLQFCPRPEYLFPAYFQGRTLAESYYLAIPALSWQNIVLGDPLCTLGSPQTPGRK